MLKFEYPVALYLLLALIPAWLLVIVHMRSFVASLTDLKAQQKKEKTEFIVNPAFSIIYEQSYYFFSKSLLNSSTVICAR